MSLNRMVDLSLVSPVYNEQEKIGEFIERSHKTLLATSRSFEIVLVNDCSTDNTLTVLKDYCSRYPELKVINLRRNSGQHIATSIGLRESHGEYTFMMDSDLQVDPEKINELLREAESNEDWDIISTFRAQRSKKLSRRLGSWAVSFILQRITRSRMKDIGSTFKLIKRNALDRMIESDILIQNLPILMMHLGFIIKEIKIDYNIDQERKSHYKIKDLVFAILLALLNFTTGQNTLLFLIVFGSFLTAGGLMMFFGIVVKGMIYQSILPTNLLLFSLFILLIGLIFLLLGIISFKLERINKNMQFRKAVDQHFDVLSSGN